MKISADLEVKKQKEERKFIFDNWIDTAFDFKRAR